MNSIELDKYSNLLDEYTELRIQQDELVRIILMNGNVTVNKRVLQSGVSSRVYKKGSWGFASNPDITDESIKLTVKKAINNASILNAKQNKNKGKLPSDPYKIEKDFTKGINRFSQKEFIEFLKKLDNYTQKKYSNLSSRNIYLWEFITERKIITSDGSLCYTKMPKSILVFEFSIEKNGEPFMYDEYTGTKCYLLEEDYNNPAELYPNIDSAYENLMKKTESVYARSGIKNVILDSKLVGSIVHEAIGHPTEADYLIEGNEFSRLFGKQIASPLLTIVDFAHTAFGNPCPVPIYIDDEGTKAKDVVIIENGVQKKIMNNKEAALDLKVNPTGNARAEKFSDEPLIRMRNTAILPGKDKLENMITSIDDGYYLIRPGAGNADATTEFMFEVVLGYEIKKGKLGKMIRNTAVSGLAIDTLKTVSMVSDNFEWKKGSFCGKWYQIIPVGMGGGAIKCKVNVGGK